MSASVQRPSLIVADRWRDYQLLDCGDGLKHERWGAYNLVRPDPQIIWPRHGTTPGAKWENWDGFYHRSEQGGGKWEYRKSLPDHWKLAYDSLGLTFKIHPTSFKHTGLFPEQAVNWEWFSAKIKTARAAGRPVNVLNLFGYTGAATCAAAKAGASVTHIDAAEGMVKWCKENAVLSGLSTHPSATSPTTASNSSAANKSAANSTTPSSWTRLPTVAAPRAKCGNSKNTSGHSSASAARCLRPRRFFS
ncbi:MAG: hypothetical protein WCQ44_00050 [Opitutaceae bacterium]